eukprot:gene42343-52511_t
MSSQLRANLLPLLHPANRRRTKILPVPTTSRRTLRLTDTTVRALTNDVVEQKITQTEALNAANTTNHSEREKLTAEILNLTQRMMKAERTTGKLSKSQAALQTQVDAQAALAMSLPPMDEGAVKE